MSLVQKATLPTRKIGSTSVTAIGYGAMGIAAYYSAPLPDEERFKILDAVYERGCTNWDSADCYGDSEVLIGNWFKRTGKRSEIFIATKFGITPDPNRTINGDPAYVKQQLQNSLNRLQVDQIDLWYLHRPDPTVPIEITVGAMAEGVKAGKVKYLGLSECSEATLRRAHAVHPITAYQVEYSPFTLDIEDPKIGVLKAARELGITIVAYSPIGRGLLTGKYKGPEDFEEGDFRRIVPRYSKENFPNILKIADGLKEIGKRHNATAGQVALAWVLAQGEDVIPIPGTTKIPNLEENLAAAKIKLTPEELDEVRRVSVAAGATNSSRVSDGLRDYMFGDTPAL